MFLFYDKKIIKAMTLRQNIFAAIVAVFVLSLSSCSNTPAGTAAASGSCAGDSSCAARVAGTPRAVIPDSVGVDSVRVLVFHGVRQCETCQAIKRGAREVVEGRFAGRPVSFSIIDFSKDEGKPAAEKYQVAWTSLILVGVLPGDAEIVDNLSQMAIKDKNANSRPAEFKDALAAEIGKMLH